MVRFAMPVALPTTWIVAVPGRKDVPALMSIVVPVAVVLRHEDAQLQQPDGHNLTLLWADFLKAIDTGQKPVSGIETAHRSSVLPLLGMISWRLGRSIEWDGEREQIVDDPEGSRLLSPSFRSPWTLPA